MTRLEIKVKKALEIAKMGMNDGASEKMWVIDQMVRALTGEDYELWVKETEAGEDGPHTYDWETGTPP